MMTSKKLIDLLEVTPHPYQYKGVRFIKDHKWVVIGDEMGLGKSLQAIGAAHHLKKKTLICCPAYLRLTWEYEIYKLSKQMSSVKICETVLDYDLDDIDDESFDDYDFIIMSYNRLDCAEELFKWAEFIVFDEVQYLKGIESDRTFIAHTLIDKYKPEYFAGLSGTPIKNGVSEWFSILTMLGYCPHGTNGLKLSDYYKEPEDFYKEFCWMRYKRIGGGRYVKQFEGFRNKHKLPQFLRDKYIRRKAKDELDLPNLLRKDIIVDYSSNPELEVDWIHHNSDPQFDSRAKAKSALVKAAFTVRYSKDLHKWTGNPIVIFSDHIDSTKKIAKALGVPHVTGQTPVDKRREIARAFQRGERDYFVATIGSASTGINELVVSNHLVVNDKSWVPAHNDQMYKRIHRIGQGLECTIHEMGGSVQDVRINARLAKKSDVLKDAM